MLLKRQQLIYGFATSNVPAYGCPYCEAGALQLVGKLDSQVTEASKRDQDYEFDPDGVVLTFGGKLKCASCSDVVFFTGTGGLEIEHCVGADGGWESEWVEYHNPRFFYPPLKIVICPEKTPYLVKEKIVAACESFFSQPDSCCNSLRAAAEEILTDLKVDLNTASGGFLRFSDRINKLPTEKEGVKALFDAVRWLGNHGSHAGSVLTRSDAMDAFEIMNLLLEELYSDSRLKAQELARRINLAKGPVGKHS
ncbi:DUF4145 domain-containing protein [Pseudomonas aylmerensis]|uniref:DUF4145 domain-containing protein n=1 Tax=Pseudomonas aylmerensis TaxID=1869229 RepID=A0A2T4FN63_9PSED|nr:DUF4145 domain-containing protein [Pseudomonas aylmerensis]PTC24820.1 DUF4145 domain-containing protein [Pseudomonas aylmerensis]